MQIDHDLYPIVGREIYAIVWNKVWLDARCVPESFSGVLYRVCHGSGS
jgi:hypothetical protein